MKKMTTLAATVVAGSLFLAGGAVAEMGSSGQKDVQQKSGQTGQIDQQSGQASGQNLGQPSGQQPYGKQSAGTVGQQGAGIGTQQQVGQTEGLQQSPQLLSASKIRQVQQKLQAAGFDPGEVDGVWGPQTSQAMEQFQQRWGLAATGKPNDQSLQILGVQSGSQGQEFIGVSPSFQGDQQNQQQNRPSESGPSAGSAAAARSAATK